MGSSQSKRPNLGDLIEISHGDHQHWAVYVGDKDVVHLVDNSSGPGTVRKEKLMDMVGKDKWRVNNLHDRKWSPRPAQNIVKEALSWTDKDVKYSIDSWNCEHFATRLRYDRSMPTQGAERLEPGDLIEISHGMYQHWAVYIGDEEVVHLINNSSGSLRNLSIISSISVEGKVRRDKLEVVVKSFKWQKNNTKHPFYDIMLKPRPKEEIVKEALSRVGMDVEYNITTWNCEHFVTECRYGKALSVQGNYLAQVKKLPTGSFADFPHAELNSFVNPWSNT